MNCIYCNKKDPEAEVDGQWFHIECHQKKAGLKPAPKFTSQEVHPEKTHLYNARKFSMLKVDADQAERLTKTCKEQQDQEDWLQIYCSLIQGRSSEVNLSRITPTGFVEATNMLFEAYKQKWDNSDA